MKWKLVSDHLEIVLISMQDRCTVCTKHAIVSKVILAHPMELLSDVGHAESLYFVFGDSVSVCAR